MRGIFGIFKNYGFITGVIGLGYLFVAPVNGMFNMVRSASLAEFAISVVSIMIVFLLAFMFVFDLKRGMNRNPIGVMIDVFILSNHYVLFVGEISYLLGGVL